MPKPCAQSIALKHSPAMLRVNVAAIGTLLLVCIGQFGCARSLHNIDTARDAFSNGDLVTARATLQEIAEGRSGNRDAAELDLAMVELATGDVRTAESRLRQLRDQFDAAPGISPLREAASIVTDDTARVFRPAGYEEVMVRAMLSVCSLAGDQVDAESYSLQATTKQAELAQQASERGITDLNSAYQPIALAPYLRGILREATHHDYDDATKAYQLVSSVRPQFAPAQADIARASGGAHSAPGHGVLYVIACVGRGPILRETTAPTTTIALTIASSVLNAETNEETDQDGNTERVDGPVLPNIASVKVPEVIIPPSNVAAVGVRVNGELHGATQTLTDVGELAVNQVQAEMPWTIARAVVRRATKETTVASVGDTLGLDGTAGSLFHFAASTAWSGVEHADTRCWGLLPREIQVMRTELPAGQHEINLQPMNFDGELLSAGHSQSVNVVDGQNQYLIVIAPDQALYVVTSPTTTAASPIEFSMSSDSLSR
ncbi:MAG: hypothetical protein ACR2NZ_19155 [Rubripirellula sp.]